MTQDNSFMRQLRREAILIMRKIVGYDHAFAADGEQGPPNCYSI